MYQNMNSIQQLGLFSNKFEVCGCFVSLPLENGNNRRTNFVEQQICNFSVCLTIKQQNKKRSCEIHENLPKCLDVVV